MEKAVWRLVVVHVGVLVLASVAGALVWGGAGSLSALAGAFCFSIPVVAFSGLVLRASTGDQRRFLGRFMAAEALKWVSAAALLAVAFLVRFFLPQPLLAGFIVSVLAQVLFPIFLRKESQS
jgi:F0F1-type ATP synthase assembly protein I